MQRFITPTAFALIAASALAFAAPADAAETYQLDPSHTNILWQASHFGFSSPSGRFGIQSGSLTLDEAAPQNSRLSVTIDTAGLVTGIPKFDEHLKSADFLDTATYPDAAFNSTRVEPTGPKTARVHGHLTLHGVTRPVVLDVTLNQIAPSPMTQKKTAGFSAKTVIKRSEFGIDKHLPGISDEVSIAIESEANLAP